MLDLVQHRGPCLGDTFRVFRLSDGPNHDFAALAVRQTDQPQPLGVLRRGRGVHQEHDRSLQPFRAMHGHHANLVARDLHVALHLGVGGAQPGQKSLQRGGRPAFIGQCEFEEFVQGVIRLVPEPAQDASTPAVAAKQPGVEGKRGLMAEAPFALFEAVENGLEPVICRGLRG